MPEKVLCRRVEHHNFVNRSRLNLRVTLHDRMKMQIAHRAASEPPKLQVYEPLPVRYQDALGMDGNQLVGFDNGARLNLSCCLQF